MAKLAYGDLNFERLKEVLHYDPETDAAALEYFGEFARAA